MEVAGVEQVFLVFREQALRWVTRKLCSGRSMDEYGRALKGTRASYWVAAGGMSRYRAPLVGSEGSDAAWGAVRRPGVAHSGVITV